jgi:hypothetical protein
LKPLAAPARVRIWRFYVFGIILAAGAVAILSPVALSIASDATTYLAAGERLNAGHHLYALSAGDRPVLLSPPFVTVPLLYPPFIAVIWRPLAMAGEIARIGWWLGAALATLAVVGYVTARANPWSLVLLLFLSIGIGEEIVVGNLDGYILLGLALLWLYRDRPWSGAVLGLMVAVKVAPVVLGLWVLGQRRWAVAGLAIITGLVCLVTGIVFAGWSAHLEYVHIASSIYPSRISLAGITGQAGMTIIAIGIGAAAIWVSRVNEGLSFRLAVLTMVFGSPVVNVHTLVLLVAVLLPTTGPTPSWRRMGYELFDLLHMRRGADVEPAGAPTAR